MAVALAAGVAHATPSGETVTLNLDNSTVAADYTVDLAAAEPPVDPPPPDPEETRATKLRLKVTPTPTIIHVGVDDASCVSVVVVPDGVDGDVPALVVATGGYDFRVAVKATAAAWSSVVITELDTVACDE